MMRNTHFLQDVIRPIVASVSVWIRGRLGWDWEPGAMQRTGAGCGVNAALAPCTFIIINQGAHAW